MKLNRHFKKSICIIVFLSFGFRSHQATTLGGLMFHGSEQPIDQRTSYNVFGDKVVGFQDNFTLEFFQFITSQYRIFSCKGKTEHPFRPVIIVIVTPAYQ